MPSSPISPRILKGGIVLLDPATSKTRIIPLQYNPETISRSLQVQSAGEGGNRSEALRLSGPPVETYNLEVAIDATDQLEAGDRSSLENGIQPMLATLETIVYPKSTQLASNDKLAQNGAIEILPVEAPLTLFVWSKNRVVPVRITEFSIVEEAFDTNLNPIRATITLGMRVLNIDDFGYGHKGSSLFMVYQKEKEKLSAKFSGGDLGSLGINKKSLV